ncbi:MAG: PQQ-binding-like beta-propeller repeat protein [Vicinamibacterales bacterium]
MWFAAAALAAALTLWLPPPAEPQTLSWRQQTAKDVQYLRVTGGGRVLVGTSNETRVVDGETGRVLWSRTDIRDCEPVDAPSDLDYEFKCDTDGGDLNFVLLPSEPPRLVGHHAPDGRLAIVDAASGQTLFDSTTQSLGKVRRYLLSPRGDQVVVAVERKGTTLLVAGLTLGDGSVAWRHESTIAEDPIWIDSAGDSLVVLTGRSKGGGRVLAAFDTSAGTNVFERTDILRQEVREAGPRMVGAEEWRSKAYRIAPLIADGDAIVAFVSKDGPFRLDALGRVLWRAEDLADVEPSRMELEGGVLYVRSDDNVFAIDAATGRTRWRQKARFEPRALAPLAGVGLLLLSPSRVDLLSLGSGAPVWPRPADIPKVEDARERSPFSPGLFLGGVSPLLVRDDALIVAGGRTLARVDLATGTRADLAAYEFKGGEAPELLEARPEGFLLAAHQNLLGVAPDGAQRFSRFYPAPGMNGWKKLGLGLLSFGAGDPSLLYATLRMRYSRQAVVESSVYMHFENKDGAADQQFGLVRLDKRSGEETGVLWHNERRPVVVVDPDVDRVYVRRQGTTLEAYQFPR